VAAPAGSSGPPPIAGSELACAARCRFDCCHKVAIYCRAMDHGRMTRRYAASAAAISNYCALHFRP
jgi:hypothetical protein